MTARVGYGGTSVPVTYTSADLTVYSHDTVDQSGYSVSPGHIDGHGVDDGLAYDRSAGAVWSDAPNGAITIFADVLLVLAQSGHICQGPP